MTANTTTKTTSPVGEAVADAYAAVARLHEALKENPAATGRELAAQIASVGGTDSHDAGLLGEILSALDILHTSPVVRLRGDNAPLSTAGRDFVQDGLLHVTEELGPRVREALSATAYAATGLVPQTDFRTTFRLNDENH
ncbi:hypothetical protein AB0M58_14120 [Streptomyces bobili]|uniref:hypothetical protein n=1 Tax=Streptomyces bobili TaxID=67280 RepID=UPI00342D0A6F